MATTPKDAGVPRPRDKWGRFKGKEPLPERVRGEQGRFVAAPRVLRRLTRTEVVQARKAIAERIHAKVRAMQQSPSETVRAKATFATVFAREKARTEKLESRRAELLFRKHHYTREQAEKRAHDWDTFKKARIPTRMSAVERRSMFDTMASTPEQSAAARRREGITRLEGEALRKAQIGRTASQIRAQEARWQKQEARAKEQRVEVLIREGFTHEEAAALSQHTIETPAMLRGRAKRRTEFAEYAAKMKMTIGQLSGLVRNKDGTIKGYFPGPARKAWDESRDNKYKGMLDITHALYLYFYDE